MISYGPLSPKQRAAWSAMADHRITICDGAVRSGKSVGADIAWIDFVRHGPPGNLAMIGKTERTLKRNVIDPIMDILGSRRCRYVQGRGELHIGGRRIYVYGANDERAQEKLRGVTLVGAYVDEATLVPESLWTILLQRLSLPGSRLIATTNPDSPMHWLKRWWLDRAAELGLAHLHFTLEDNRRYLGDTYIEDIKREHTGLWYRRFIDGAWVAAEGAVYGMLEVESGGRHVASVLPELRQLRLAIDYGTNNPFVALLLGVSAEPRLYVAREWRYDGSRKRQLSDAEYVERLEHWIASGCDGFSADEQGRGSPVPIERVLVDPSALSFRVAWSRVFGSMPHPADNDVLDGIRDVASLLSRDQLVFHESCQETIAEHVGYVWDPKAQEKGEDAPLKLNDHGVDAARYGARSYRTTWRHWPQVHRITEEAA